MRPSPAATSMDGVQLAPRWRRGERKGRVPLRIVAYVGDAHYVDIRSPIPPTVYVPFRTSARTENADSATFVVRTSGPNPLSLVAMLRQEVQHARPELRVSNVHTQEELVRRHTNRERMLAVLSLFFAVVALIIAAVGVYGVLDHAVLQRRRELGIRIALGASGGDIATRVTVEIFSMLLIGAIAGLSLGLASERYVTTLLYHVKATDVSVLATPVLTVLSAAVLAAFPPVLRAIRTDPTEMLRSE